MSVTDAVVPDGCRPADGTSRRRLAGIAVLLLALAGIALIGNAVWIKAKATLAQVLLERSFTSALSGDVDARPWPWADFRVEGRITAERLGRSAIVLSGATGQALAFGPAHVAGTARAGEPGASVIAAHRDTHFAWLKDVRPGDTLTVLRADGASHRFVAESARIVRHDELSVPVGGEPLLALSTCWPFDAVTPGPLRYVLFARAIASE